MKKIAEMRKKGASYAEIGRSLSMSPSTVKSWLREKRTPAAVSLKRFDFFAKERKPISIPKSKYPQFAYVLGGFFGNVFKVRSHCPDLGERRVELQNVDREFAAEFAKNLEASTGHKVTAAEVTRKEKNRKKVYKAKFFSSNLIQLLNRVTNYGQRIPVEFLHSKQARANFLKALFDSWGRLRRSPPAGTIFIEYHTENKPLADFSSIALLEQGVQHAISKKKEKYVIRIGPVGVKKFKQAIGFRAKRKQTML